VFLKLPVGSRAKKRLTVIEHETRHRSTERAGTHGKGLGGGNGHKPTKEEREASFVCYTRGKCRALRNPQQQELLCISFSSDLLLLPIALASSAHAAAASGGRLLSNFW
jgi:hypothetical protein